MRCRNDCTLDLLQTLVSYRREKNTCIASVNTYRCPKSHLQRQFQLSMSLQRRPSLRWRLYHRVRMLSSHVETTIHGGVHVLQTPVESADD
jgi:hypothetical protein